MLERRTLEWLWARYGGVILGLGIGLVLGIVYLIVGAERTLWFALLVGSCGLIGFFLRWNRKR